MLFMRGDCREPVNMRPAGQPGRRCCSHACNSFTTNSDQVDDTHDLSAGGGLSPRPPQSIPSLSVRLSRDLRLVLENSLPLLLCDVVLFGIPMRNTDLFSGLLCKDWVLRVGMFRAETTEHSGGMSVLNPAGSRDENQAIEIPAKNSAYRRNTQHALSSHIAGKSNVLGEEG